MSALKQLCTAMKEMGSEAKSSLANGEELHEGERLVSPSEKYYLTLQADGRLAIYEKDKPEKALWKSTISAKVPDAEGPFVFRMQRDCNSVVYDGKERAIWHTGVWYPDPNGIFHIGMADDMNFYVRDEENEIIWTSHTNIRRFDEGKEGKSVLDRGEEFHSGQYLVSPNEQFYLTLQPDAHLVIYAKNEPDKPVWKSTINSEVQNIKGPFVFKLQADNDIVVHDANGQLIWHSNTATDGFTCRVSLLDDGGLLVHSKDRTDMFTWSSKLARAWT